VVDSGTGTPARPTAAVPVAPQIGCLDGDHHHVAQARWYLAVATGTRVGLGGLIRLDEPDLEFAENAGILHCQTCIDKRQTRRHRFIRTGPMSRGGPPPQPPSRRRRDRWVGSVCSASG